MTDTPRSSWLSPRPPAIAVELASGWVSAVGVRRSSGRDVLTGHAVERLPHGAVTPRLTGENVGDPEAVAAAARRAIERAGFASTARAALVLPDRVVRVSLLEFEEVPAKAADLDRVVEWRLRKSTPFPMEDASVSHFVAHAREGATTLAVLVARRDVVAQYEGVASAVGLHAGIVDVASFNVINTILASDAAGNGDWLVIHLAAEATTIAIMRGAALMFYRQRATVDGEPLSALVHQTAMYHEDRLDGGTFARVWLAGGAGTGLDLGEARRELETRLGVAVETVDVRLAAGLGGLTEPSAGDLDAIAAPAGILLRAGRGT